MQAENEGRKEQYTMDRRWVDTATNIYRVSPSMSVSLEMADYSKGGDFTWTVDGEDVPCDFMEIMLVPPRDSRFYRDMLGPDEALLARVWFKQPAGEPELCELIRETPDEFDIQSPLEPGSKPNEFSGGGYSVVFTEEEFSSIMDFAKKTREFHTALGLKNYEGEEKVEDALQEHLLSSEIPADTKRFAEWVNNSYGKKFRRLLGETLLSEKTAEKILEYYAEHEFGLLIGDNGKLYEYDEQENLEGFSEQSFENVLENTMGMIEQNGEIERERDEMKSALKKDLKEMEKVAEKLAEAKEKSATDKKIRKKHSKDSSGKEEWREYDENGNETHFRISDGYEEWREYDENGNETHFRILDVYEEWREYDGNNNKVHSKNSNRLEEWYDYDENGNMTHYKNSNRLEEWCDYDENGNMTHYKDSNKLEKWYDYDENGNMTHYKNFNGFEEWRDYDENKNVTHLIDSYGYEVWREYDANGKETHYKDSNKIEIWQEYDENGSLVHYKTSDGDETWREYDASGRETHYRDSSGYEKWTDYVLEGEIQREPQRLEKVAGQISRFLGENISADDIQKYIGNHDWEEGEDLDYKATSFLADRLQSAVATEEELAQDTNCKLQNRAFNLAGEIIAEERMDRKNVLSELTKYGEEIGVIAGDKMKKTAETIENSISGKKLRLAHTKSSSGSEIWREYDADGNMVHYKTSDGDETWREFDENGNIVHWKNTNGKETWYEYDADGRETHYKDSGGYEVWHEYDANGNETHYKDSNKIEIWQEYDENGSLVHYKDSSGFEKWREYSADGKWTHYKDSDGKDEWRTYDENGNMVHCRKSNGYEEWREYNAAGKETHYRDSNGFEEWRGYDAAGNETYYKDSSGYERWREYNADGNMVHDKTSGGLEEWWEYNAEGRETHYRDSNGYEEWYEYDENGNETHYRDSSGIEEWTDYVMEGEIQREIPEDSRERDRSMRNLRAALGGIKNGYNDSLDDYDESVYARKGMWSARREESGGNEGLSVSYNGKKVISVSENFARVYPEAVSELAKKSIDAGSVMSCIEKIRPDFRLGLSKSERTAVKDMLGKEFTLYEMDKNGRIFDTDKKSYINRAQLSKMIESYFYEKTLPIKHSDELAKISVKLEEKAGLDSYAPPENVRDLHAALEGLVNGYNNNLDEYEEHRRAEKSPWTVINENGTVRLQYAGENIIDINIKEHGIELYDETKNILERNGIRLEDVLKEAEDAYPDFCLGLTKDEAGIIGSLLDRTRMHHYLELDENGRVFESEDNYYPDRKQLGYLLKSGIEAGREDRANYIMLDEAEQALVEKLSGEKMDEKFLKKNAAGDLADVIDAYINSDTDKVDELSPGEGARKGIWEIREKTADIKTGEMTGFEIRYRDMIVAEARNGEVTNRISEVHYEDEISFGSIMDELKKFYPEIREAVSREDFMLAPSLNDRFRWLAEGADEMSAEKFGAAEKTLEKALEGLTDSDLAALMSMKDSDGNTAAEIWENEFSYLQSTNESEGIESDGSVPYALVKIRTAQNRAEEIKFMRQEEGVLHLRHGKYHAAEALMDFVNEKYHAEILSVEDARTILYEYWEASTDILVEEKTGKMYGENYNPNAEDWEKRNERDLQDMLDDIEMWNDDLADSGWQKDPVMKERYEETSRMLSRVKEKTAAAKPELSVLGTVSYGSIIELQDFFGAEHLEDGEMVRGFGKDAVRLAENDTAEFYDGSPEKEEGYSREQYFLIQLAADALNERFADYPGWREMEGHDFPERFPERQDKVASAVIEKLGLGLEGSGGLASPAERIKYMAELDRMIGGMTNLIALQEILSDEMKSGLDSTNFVRGLDGNWSFLDMPSGSRSLNYSGINVFEVDRGTKEVSYDIRSWRLIEDKTGLEMGEILGEAERIWSQDKSLGAKFPVLPSEAHALAGEKTDSARSKTAGECSTQELWQEINRRDDFLGGKIWVKDDLKMYIEKNRDEGFASLEQEGSGSVEKFVDSAAGYINTDGLCDCTDAEWEIIGDACSEALKERQMDIISKIKNNAKAATRGFDAEKTLEESRRAERHPAAKEVKSPHER